ncbi:MFS transporter, partial [Psittacicella gerlachiana]
MSQPHSATTIYEPDYDTLSKHQRSLRKKLPKRWLLVLILTLLSIITGLENTSFSPAIGQLKEQFQVSIIALQAFFLCGMGIGQLFWGPMIDNWGRKPIVIICSILGIFTNISIVNVDQGFGLYLNRFLQGFCFGGLGLLSTIILKDIYPTRRFVIYNSWIVFFYVCSPALGPLWGGSITVLYGWRTIFNILTVGLISLLVLYVLLIPETIASKHKLNFDLKQTLPHYKLILGNNRARFLILFNIGYSICIFSLPILIPNILINEYQVDPNLIGAYFLIP